MRTDPETLRRDLLACGGNPEGVERALAGLAPFFAIAESGSYPLGRASFADVGGIATALWRAGGFHVKGCAFLASCLDHRAPLANPPPSEAATFYRRLRDRYDGELTPALSNPRFDAAFERALGSALEAALGRALKGSGALAAAHPWDDVRYVLSAFTAFAAEGRREADALGPLVALLASHVPLFEGTGRNEGIWCVLSGC